MRCLTILAAWVSLLVVAGGVRAADKMPERWNYVTANLGTDAGTQKFIDILKLSKDNGCTNILMPEGGWLRGADRKPYLVNVQKVKDAAKELNLTIVPTVFAFGYGGRYLGFDHNLMAGIPVKNMDFIVKGTTAVVDPAQAVTIPEEDKDGFRFFKVKPFTHYRVNFHISEAYKGDRDEVLKVLSTGNGRRWISRDNVPRFTETGNGWDVTTTFNSVEATDVRLEIHCKGVTGLKIEPAGLLMILRRDLIPLTVTSEDGKTVYEEGKDFKPVADPNIAANEETNMDHPAVNIDLTNDSRIKDGQKLEVSFWHAYRMGGDQDVLTMQDPKVFDIMDQDVKNCVKVWQPAGIFMNYDEIRIGGWEPQPDGQTLTSGQILAQHAKKGYDMIRKYAPDAKVYTWSDMFSPFHNASPKSIYYMVNGNWSGSWETLPKDVIIFNWSAADNTAMKFFGDRGNPQILSGFYDSTSTQGMKQNINHWMKVSEGVPNILGFMYTTWHGNFKQVPEYFKLVDSYSEWGGAMPAGKQQDQQAVMSPGIWLMHKPVGPTSFSLVKECLAQADGKKVCHGGALDPFASGLMLILVEPATKLFDYLHAIPKVYEATVRWGIETDNGDLHGRPVSTADASSLTPAQLDNALATFAGWHDQIPPAASNKRVDGERAYLKAHRGEAVVLPASKVYLHEARWLSHDLPRQSRMRLTVRGGYYVRALARDIGRLVGCGAHLTQLHRTAIGPWLDPGPGKNLQLHGREILPWASTRILSDKDIGDIRQSGTIQMGESQPPDWSVPDGFPDPAAPVRGFHHDRFCFLLKRENESLRVIAGLRGGL